MNIEATKYELLARELYRRPATAIRMLKDAEQTRNVIMSNLTRTLAITHRAWRREDRLRRALTDLAAVTRAHVSQCTAKSPADCGFCGRFRVPLARAEKALAYDGSTESA